MSNKLIKCKSCGREIAANVKECPACGVKNKKPIYKRIWFWIIAIIVILGVATAVSNSKKVTVAVVDMSTMTEADVDKWANENKINIKKKEEYSDTVAKGKVISQSVEANKNCYEGDKITVVYSLGKEPTEGQKNALKRAESYSSTTNMSKKGIYRQLTSEFEKFKAEEAQYAVDNMKVDWNANALARAKSYQKNSNMSKQRIYEQLTSEFEQFTPEEAKYAVDNLGN